MGSKAFKSEIWARVDDRIMRALADTNREEITGCVGGDVHSKRVEEILQGYFKDKIYTTFAINGTGANMLALKSMLDRYSSVICAPDTHINTNESGATEFTLGNKIFTCGNADGKLDCKSIEKTLVKIRRFKYLPRVVVLTQPTELGVLYTVDEIRKICSLAHSEGMYVYIDGARLGNALAALDSDLTEMIESTDVDAFSIGGTKAGAMFGEVVVFRREEHSRHLDYLQKQSFQHFDKSTYLAVQLECLLENGIWLENARRNNKLAKVFEEKLLKKDIKPYFPVDTNVVFLQLDKYTLNRLSTEFDLHYWDNELKLVRFVVYQDTAEEDIDRVISLL